MNHQQGRPFLICHDGSDAADIALTRAAELFPAAQVVVLHVSKSLIDWGLAPLLHLPDNEQFDQWVLDAAQDRLEAAVAKAQTLGLDARGELRTTARSVWRTVAEVANEVRPHTIVVGKHGIGRLGRTRIGSVAQALTTNSPVPVLVVHPDAPAYVSGAPVLVAWNDSEGARRALDVATKTDPNAPLLIASVWESLPAWVLQPPPVGSSFGPSYDDNARAAAEQSARAAGEAVTRLGRDVQIVVEHADDGVAAALISLAEARGAGLISVGSSGMDRFPGALGSVAHAVVAESPIPVLVARECRS